MKKRIYLPVILAAAMLTGTGCKKYVDKGQIDKFDDNNFWKSEDNVRIYSWNFYSVFSGYGNNATFGDFYFTSLSDDQVGASLKNFTLTVPSDIGGTKWNFEMVRRANLLLERIDRVPTSDETKNHWKGFARFFRAYCYYILVREYGDVPWMDKVPDVTDENYLYKGRDSRTVVMDNVLADLDFAIANLRTKDQENTVNKYVALALKSRIGLFEGTWRKYHNIQGGAKFLLAAKDAGDQLMKGPFTLNPQYKTIYNSMDLAGNKEAILYKKYVVGYLGHSLINYLSTSTQMDGISKDAVESFVCTDGLPIAQSPQYAGDEDLKHTLTNRDGRLIQSVDTVLAYKGKANKGLTTSTGYRPAKFLNPQVASTDGSKGDTDAPLFWLAEVLLNYAEAAAELNDLGQYAFSQGDLDKTVNLLRARAGVAKLEYLGGKSAGVSGKEIIDAKNKTGVSSLIWEIRRERRSELMLDGFRKYDLFRWKLGTAMNTATNPDIIRGAKIPEFPAGTTEKSGKGRQWLYHR
ncbi:RagB/SusD family nutrient uptake outer membrane protein [Chitinophaga oryzae]|uniref:RagB/SusD family nutrient uptake outer membrane protein n=1 Tax=Chitinophaga oryzae TaxID=2725414 RepID=A0AAE7D589_9BACT|nr:RagB/SusD family nutrient uptake outer membrane protein [Chitinophaga oryzae]QJB29774.1 RagB/SusD family nutrient uptake outer membrane protein [Chitinophaga oryzae]